MKSAIIGLVLACFATSAFAETTTTTTTIGADAPALEQVGHILLIRFPSTPKNGGSSGVVDLPARGVCELFAYPSTIAYGVDAAGKLTWAMCRVNE